MCHNVAESANFCDWGSSSCRVPINLELLKLPWYTPGLVYLLRTMKLKDYPEAVTRVDNLTWDGDIWYCVDDSKAIFLHQWVAVLAEVSVTVQ